MAVEQSALQDFSGSVSAALEAHASGDYDTFQKAAMAIVEPHLSSSAQNVYDEWFEDNIDSWAGFIKSTLGSEWGKVAHIVADEGY